MAKIIAHATGAEVKRKPMSPARKSPIQAWHLRLFLQMTTKSSTRMKALGAKGSLPARASGRRLRRLRAQTSCPWHPPAKAGENRRDAGSTSRAGRGVNMVSAFRREGQKMLSDLRMRLAAPAPVRLVELFRLPPGNGQRLPAIPYMDAGNLNNLADMVAGVAQRAFQAPAAPNAVRRGSPLFCRNPRSSSF